MEVYEKTIRISRGLLGFIDLRELLVQQLVRAHLPPTPDANTASIALLQSWLAEDATDNPDDIQQAQAELDAFTQAINAERERAGARRIYP